MVDDRVGREEHALRARDEFSQYGRAQNQAGEQLADHCRLPSPAHQIGKQARGQDEQYEFN